MTKHGNLSWPQHLIAALAMFCLTAFALNIIFGTWLPKTTLGMAALIAFFVIAPIGGIWMLYDCAFREKPPIIYFLLSPVPYAFIWYYFDRVRSRPKPTSS
jgi:hypothetical protein